MHFFQRNKNVAASAKSIINFYREVNPKLLEKKYRGRFFQGDQEYNEILKYGQDQVANTIQGVDLLEQYEKANGLSKGNEVPICFDRVLSDADFKRIKLLQKRKKEEEDQEKEKLLNKLRGFKSEEDEEMEEEEEEGGEEEDGEEVEDEEEDGVEVRI